MILILQGTSSINTVTVPDNAGTRLGGSRLLGANDILMLLYDGANWVETSYADN